MKKEYVTPEISVYKTDPTLLLTYSLEGGEPGDGDVNPEESLLFDN